MKRVIILKLGQNFENGSIFWKWVKNLKMCQKIWKWVKILKMSKNYENGAKFSKRGKKKLEVRVICAWNARQVRVNLVPESARHLQMTRTRQMRVICVRVRVKYLRPLIIIHVNLVHSVTLLYWIVDLFPLYSFTQNNCSLIQGLFGIL